jgi:hypothetical protein
VFWNSKVRRVAGVDTSARRIGRWLLAVVLAGAGVVVGWLVVTGVLALPLPEAVLFGLSALVAAVFVAGAVLWRQLWGRALMVGCGVGVVGSIGLVLLLV